MQIKGSIWNKEMIQAQLAKNLPQYMIPSFFSISEGFPRLPNGKINKKALVLEVDVSENNSATDLDTLSVTEKKLIHLWETVLKIKNINLSRKFI